jgi:hypothetical protein
MHFMGSVIGVLIIPPTVADFPPAMQERFNPHGKIACQGKNYQFFEIHFKKLPYI